MKKKMNVIQTALFVVVLFGLSFWCWFKPSTDFSESERRNLDKLPEISLSSITSGNFMTSFEDYTLDQFPMRDSFRSLKALSNFYVFGRLDNNDIYITDDGVIGKLEYPLKEDSIVSASNKFRYIFDKYLNENNNVYLSIIPDKNAFIAEENGKLLMDYIEFYSLMKNNCDFAKYIDISDLLSIEDYYMTDTHWKQEKIRDVANRLAENIGVVLVDEYEEKTLDKDFYGVYYGQSALNLKPDVLKYLTNDILEQCTVYDHQNNKKMTMYDMEKAYGKDPYEMFLSGSLSLITIENPKATSDKEIVVFRDSFGSSLVPLLCSGFKSITVVDIRYVSSVVLDKYIDFENKDVLFIYSTLVLNNSSMLK